MKAGVCVVVVVVRGGGRRKDSTGLHAEHLPEVDAQKKLSCERTKR